MSRPFMPFYDGDWMRDTANLDNHQERAYFRLVMYYWARGGLPDDDKQLAQIARFSPHKWKKNRQILFAFFEEEWKHNRIEKELKKEREFSLKQSLNSASGNAKRWPKDRQTVARARVSQPQPYKEGFSSVGKVASDVASAAVTDRPQEGSPMNGKKFVPTGTPEWEEIAVRYRKKKGCAPPINKEGTGWYFDSEWLNW